VAKRFEANALADLYRRYAPLVHARAKRIVGSEAEDVVQEVFLKLLKDAPRPEAMTAWIYTTSTRLAIDRLRYRARRDPSWQTAVGEAIAAQKGRSIDELLADRDLCRRLLARMDPKVQEAVVLVHFDELGQEEAATMLGVSRRTISERLHRFGEEAKKWVTKWRT
jgi:RNA polymerase sigma-70 factor (ECF subfamily)